MWIKKNNVIGSVVYEKSKLQAREKVRWGEQMNKSEIIKNALDGNAILFLGSGFSSGARNMLNRAFYTAEGLCNELIERGNIDVNGEDPEDLKDLGYISQRYLSSGNTARDLINILKENFRCYDVADEHLLMAKIPWKKIYTTNYDDVMEVASAKIMKIREPVVATEKIGDVYNVKNAVIHINGYIGDLREETLYSTFKLTEDSYRNRTISDSDWAIALNNDIKNAKSVIFIGYSLGYDLELQQIFANEEGLRDKSLFVTYEPRRRALLTMQMFGEVYSDGLKEFSKEVEAIDSNYVRNEEKYEIVCLKNRKNIENVITTITAENVIGLLVDGIVQDELIYSGLEEKYVVERDCIKEAVDFISGEGRIVILHSDLANGKTLAIKQIERRLSQIGTVYFLDDISSGLADDLEYISSLEGQHYIICENYNILLDYEEWLIIRKYQYSNIKYIFSARSYINDNFYLKLANDLDVDYKQLAMYDLNILTDHEINNFVKYLSRYNLWGRHAAKSFSDKKGLYKENVRGKFVIYY